MIVGLPNTGKSHIFNNLTGQYSVVANYPYTTLELKRGFCGVGDFAYEIIDTPGLHCFHVQSKQELVVRDAFLEEKPDLLIQCIDANRLKQSLRLTADLLELGIPFVICLNMVDETARKGIWVDSRCLSRRVGVPVIETVAVNHLGTEDLKQALAQAKTGIPGVRYNEEIQERIKNVQSRLPAGSPFPHKSAVLLLLNDSHWFEMLGKEFGTARLGALRSEVENVRKKVKGRMAWLMNHQCSEWVEAVASQVVKKHKLVLGGVSQNFAKLSRHPVAGVPIMFLIMLLMYYAVVNVAGALASWMNSAIWVPASAFLGHLLGAGFWNDFLIGEYGVLSLGLANALLTVLPILSVFYLLYSTFEDIGYLPNLCVLTKRIFDRVGLCGGAMMPLVLGFGCKTMATLSTQTLRTRRERLIAIFLIAFAIPCAAQMALNMSILGRSGFSAFAIAYGVLLAAEVVAALILNAMMKKEMKGDFVQELPPIRLPNLRAVLVKTGYRLKDFLVEALPVFLITAVALFVADRIGLLQVIRLILSPIIVNFLNLPMEMVDALLICIARREAAAGFLIKLVNEGQLNYIQSIVAVVLTTTFIPCLANIVAMGKEIGLRSAALMIFQINIASIAMSGLLYRVLKVFF
ncbi:MAG: ferrous iron transport protein B [Deltaproteobacteria bacterium]